MTTRWRHPKQCEGFTIIEVLVSLVIAGLLMAALGMVMTQVIQNDAVLADVQGASTRTATLRRLLHRDLQNLQGDIKPTPEGFAFPTSHNLLLDSSLTVHVAWSFTSSQVRRTESVSAMDYHVEQILASGLDSWGMKVLDLKRGRWIDLMGAPLDKLDIHPGAIRLELVLGGEDISLLERIPYAWNEKQ